MPATLAVSPRQRRPGFWGVFVILPVYDIRAPDDWNGGRVRKVLSKARDLGLGIIQILDCLKRSGLVVNVRDGGDYWKSRKLECLIKKLEEMHCLVAAVTGAFKDAAEKLPGAVIAPITALRNFEGLEAQGVEIMRRKRVKNRRRREAQM